MGIKRNMTPQRRNGILCWHMSRTAPDGHMPTYLHDKYNWIYFEKEASDTTVRHVPDVFVLSVLNNAICQAYPNCRPLAYRFIDEHLFFFRQPNKKIAALRVNSLAGRRRNRWMISQSVIGSSCSREKA